jgi:two-component system nitrogen regulation response regulator GlnG
VRIVAASNKDLRQLIQAGLFREDLFFRLNVVPLRLPPLRERVVDVPDLARHFFKLAASEGLPLKSMDGAALERLKKHRWPGNIRELENLIRRLAALYPQDVIGEAQVEAELVFDQTPAVPPPKSSGSHPAPLSPIGDESTLSMSVEGHLTRMFAEYGDKLPPPGLYHRVLREIEYPLISIALSATRGNQIKAAELLGLNRNTLRKKVRDLDVRLMRGGR